MSQIAEAQLTFSGSAKNWHRRSTQPALTKRDASGPVLSTRKPTASGSTLAQKQDSEEEARSADADAEDRTGNGKYWLEKAAEYEGSNNVRMKESNREKCTLLAVEVV